MELGAGIAFFGLERIARFAWIRQTRGLEAETRSDPRGLIQIQTDEPENEANLA
ncbi:MAG: hypothetical protein IIU08_06915 [Clostridia bacterium]|nr:hypothetical protein [Clostridia bacterium]